MTSVSESSTNGVTTKCSSCWDGPAGPSSAVAVPGGPAFEPDGQPVGPSAASVSTEQRFRPLPEIFRLLGRARSMNSTVVPGLSSVTLKFSVVFFGFLFVPASFGDTFALKVASGDWAMAPAATASEADATTAPVSSLRNFDLLWK